MKLDTPLAALALVTGCGMFAQAAQAAPFTVNFQATSSTGQAVTATVEFFLYDSASSSDVLPDGTQHRQFTGYSMGIPWRIKEGSADTIYAAQQPGSPFQVDVYLKTDSASSLSLKTMEGPGGGSTYYEYSNFVLNLGCHCSTLFTDTLSPPTFSRYDTLSGQGELYREWFPTLPGGSSQVSHQIVAFSSAAPEPSMLGLVLAGLVVSGVQVRGKVRATKRTTGAMA